MKRRPRSGRAADAKSRRPIVRTHRVGLTCAFLLASIVSCGDPLIVLGDSPGELRIVAGIPGEIGDHVGESATESELGGPVALATSGDTLVYFTDPRSGRVLSLDIRGELRVLLDHGPCPESPRLCLERPLDLAVDSRGRVLVTDVVRHRIWRIDPQTGAAEIIAGTGQEGSAPDGAPASESPIESPTGVAVGPNGRIFFSERSAHIVRVIEQDGTLGTVAGTGRSGFQDEDDVLATKSSLSAPGGLALASGTLYVSDTGNNRIRAVELASGLIRTVAGTGTRGFGGDRGPAPRAQLAAPADISLTADGSRLFIADGGNNRIRVVNLRTGIISTFAGTGDEEMTGNLRPAGETALSDPSGVAVSSSGLLYISDTGHSVIRRTSVVF